MNRYQFTDQEFSLMEKSRVPFAIYQFLDNRVVALVLSQGFCELFGYEDRDQAYYDMSNNMYKDTHPDDAARIAEKAFRFATEGGQYEAIYRTRKKNGSGYHIIHAMGEHVYADTGERLAQVWYTDEGAYLDADSVGESALNQSLNHALHRESLLHAIYYDHLTGLPSMTYFFDLAADKKEVLLKEGRHPILLYTDFCGMRHYNRKYGFGEGDRLLQDFGRLLAKTFGNENCSRFGQDNFAVVSEETGLEEKLNGLFEACRELNNGRSLPLHVGIYSSRMDPISTSQACDRAKLACNSLQNVYSSCFSYYGASMRDAEEQRHYILENLDQAIAEHWIQICYQPIVRAVNGRVCDEEALARWRDPVKGLLPPSEFIPFLEEAGLIYKLDLYVVEQVLQKLAIQRLAGLHLVPQSVNLSRSDFDSCDIVEEICRRVDEAGFDRSLLTIEVTESMVGSDFSFMKEQIQRFQALGFPVWIDDFGSGYSSLDLLQSVKFQLLKFDMRFMQEFDRSSSGRIILTELMKMATALGVDTICEGVESEEQVRFLREIGCSKLQGFYFEKAIPLESILERYAKGIQIGFEDPRESQYYETVSRVNLYDLSVVAQGMEDEFNNFFNSIPVAILEVRNEQVRFARSNSSYREFMHRKIGLELSDDPMAYTDMPFGPGSSFMNLVRQCCQREGLAYIDEKMPDGSTVHSFAKKISTNPVTGAVAVAVAVLSIQDADQGTTFADIARALAADYFSLYYVDLRTERFIEYSSGVGEEALAMERRGENFFSESRKDALIHLYAEDRAAFVKAFTKENLLRELDEQGTFTLTYRLLSAGLPVYVNMKAMRMSADGHYIIIGVSNVDSQMRQKELLDRVRQDQISYSRIAALSGTYIYLCTVDPRTDHYAEYSATSDFEGFGIAKTGEDFFADSLKNGMTVIYPEDLPRYRRLFTKENVLREIKEKGLFSLRYRLLLGGEPKAVAVRAAIVKESDGEKLIVGVTSVDVSLAQEEE